MTDEPVRASAGWLALREPVDAQARATGLLDTVRPLLPEAGSEIRDLGCGTGSMARWLAPRLPGPQRWILYDRDAELLPYVDAHPPRAALDGAPVSVETRQGDITRLDPRELDGASLITASALLDMMNAAELDRLATSCAGADCAVLITLSVTGRVDLTPADPSDGVFGEAFNDHQRRATPEGRRLGPDAFDTAVGAFARSGLDVLVRPSPWLLGPDERAVTREWLAGWLGAACEQRPELEHLRPDYERRRLIELAEGRLSVIVHHQDLLALPA